MNNLKRFKLSIIIPFFNEAKTIVKLIRKVKAVKLKSVSKEMILVDDGSTDNSVALIKKNFRQTKYFKLIQHQQNRGKGAAVRTGFKAATGDLFLIQDADLEYPPSQIPRLIKPIIATNQQVVYGSRFKKFRFILFGSKRTILPHHYLFNRFISFLANLLFQSQLTDIETGYKLFTRQVYQKIKLKSNGFEIDPEITAKILKAGFFIQEIPIRHKPRGYSEGKKINWCDGLKAIYSLFYYRFLD